MKNPDETTAAPSANAPVVPVKVKTATAVKTPKDETKVKPPKPVKAVTPKTTNDLVVKGKGKNAVTLAFHCGRWVDAKSIQPEATNTDSSNQPE